MFWSLEWVLPICIPFGDVLYVNITGQMAEVGKVRKLQDMRYFKKTV